jgi:type I restriction enzyme S subunit
MSEWINYKLGEIGSFANGINKDKYSFGFGFPFVNLMDIFDKDIIYQIPLGLVNASQDELTRYSIKEGDILFVRSSVKLDGVGKVCAVANNLENTTFSGFIIRFRQSELFIDKIFASYYLNSSQIRRQVISKATLSANSNINQESLKSIQIQLPNLERQRKIAKILFSTDAVIEQTQSAIAKYKAIKQGLLHDLFTRGLTANGHLRPSYHEAPELYKESELGMIPKEWEVKSLEEITTKIGDGIHTTPNYTESSDYKFINGNNLVDGIINITNKTNSVSFEEYTKHKIDLNEKTVLMSINGTIGNLAYYRNERVILGKSAAYICCGNDVDVEYIYSFLGTNILLKYFTDELTGSTIQNLSLASIRNAPILYPKPVEQKMIVKILETFTNKIQTEETLLQKYQSIKRGLMGDLLGGKKEVTN